MEFYKDLTSSVHNLAQNPYDRIIVPTHFSGGGTIYANGFFLFSQFWPIDIIIVESCEWHR